MTTPSMGWASQFATVDDPVFAGPAPPATQRFEFVSCGIAKTGSHLETDGLRGHRAHIAENVTDNIYAVGGELVLRPNANALLTWLPRIMGGAVGGGGVTLLTNILPMFLVQVDKGAHVAVYRNCKVNRATFRSGRGRQLELGMDIQGLTEEIVPFPPLNLTNNGPPFMHHHCVFKVDPGGPAATSREVDDFVLTINNALALDRYFNSQSRTQLPENDRIVTVTATFPFSAVEVAAFYDKGVTTFAFEANFVSGVGADRLMFSCGAVQIPVRGPGVGGRTETLYPVEMTARQLGATPNSELITTILD